MYRNWDLIVAAFLVVVTAVTMYWLGRSLSRNASTRIVLLELLATIALILVARRYVEDKLIVTHLIPLRCAMVLTAVSPILAAFGIGVAWKHLRKSRGRGVTLAIALFGIAVWGSFRTFFAGRPPTQLDYWSGNVCLQTTAASCSPSSAVTLLRIYGIRTNEREMADLCWTTSRGTTRLGLYRGLRTKTDAAGLTVRAFRGDVASLLSRGDAPTILFVSLRSRNGVDPRYERDWGWKLGVKHVVVYLGHAVSGNVLIADPAVGTEEWTTQDLALLWSGEGVEVGSHLDSRR